MSNKEKLIKEIIEGALLLPFEIEDRQLKMIIMNLEQRVFIRENKKSEADAWEEYGKSRGYI